MTAPVPELLPPNGRVITPSLTALRQCAVLQLLEIGRPVCFFPIYWGDSPIAPQRCTCECDNGGQGEGWIRLVRVDNVTTAAPPGRSSSRTNYLPEKCAETALDTVIEMGVWRCAANIEATQPADGVFDDHTSGMVDDMAALQRAWRCCEWFADRNIKRQFTQSIPLGPAGGCVGVSVTGRALLSNCVPCPEDNGDGEEPEGG